MKLRDYIKLPSLQEYAILDQQTQEVALYRWLNDGQAEYFFDGDTVHFASIDLTLNMTDTHDGMIFNKIF